MEIDPENPEKKGELGGNLTLESQLPSEAAGTMGGASPPTPSLSSPADGKRRRSYSPEEMTAEEVQDDDFKRRKMENGNDDGKQQDEHKAEMAGDSLGKRIGMLKEMVRVLRNFISSLLTEEAYWDASPPTCDEMRLYNLIFCHVHHSIFLYHLEQQQDNVRDNSKERDVMLRLLQMFPFPEGEVLPDPMDLDDLLNKVRACTLSYLSRLLGCKRSLMVPDEVEDPTPGRQLISEKKGDDMQLLRKQQLKNASKGTYNAMQLLRKQQLQNILYTLEVLGHWRAYAPPTAGEEVHCYKEIKKWITSFLSFVAAKEGLHDIIGRKWIRFVGSLPELGRYETWGLCPSPPGYRLGVAFELIQEHRQLLDEYKQRLSQVFPPQGNNSRQLATESLTPNNTSVSVDNQNIPSVQLLKWEPTKLGGRTQGSAVKTRLDYLRVITSKLSGMPSFNEKPPNRKEIRLCALIGEHLESSHWLRGTVCPSELKAEGSYEIDAADIVHDHFGLRPMGPGQAEMGGDDIREQCLDEAVSYLTACKNSCLAEMPTKEEGKQYWELATMFGPVSEAALCPKSTEEDLTREDEDESTGLRAKLFCIYKCVQGFLNELKVELRSILSTLHGATCPQERVSFDEVLGWSREDKEIVNKLGEFFGEPVSGRMDVLHQAILFAMELEYLGSGVFQKLSAALHAAYAAWRGDDDYQIVRREVGSAFSVMICGKPFKVL